MEKPAVEVYFETRLAGVWSLKWMRCGRLADLQLACSMRPSETSTVSERSASVECFGSIECCVLKTWSETLVNVVERLRRLVGVQRKCRMLRIEA